MKNSVYEKVIEAYPRIQNKITKTPLIHNEGLSELVGCNIYLKLENKQRTQSFKFRGACNKMSLLKSTYPNIDKVVTASTGNHAAAVLEVSESSGIQPIIYVPKTIAQSKLKKLQSSNAEIRIEGEQSGDAELLATTYSRETGIPLVHPYNDIEVVAGQGSIGVELLEQLPDLDVVIVPVGGGGLISGIAGYLKGTENKIWVMGSQPANAADMVESIRQNRIVPPFTTPTISDGTAGGLEPGSITFDICKEYVDEFDTVTEEEIAHSLYLIYKHSGMMVEPAAALALAFAIKHKDKMKRKNVVLIICGGRIEKERFENIINPYHD